MPLNVNASAKHRMPNTERQMSLIVDVSVDLEQAVDFVLEWCRTTSQDLPVEAVGDTVEVSRRLYATYTPHVAPSTHTADDDSQPRHPVL